MKTDKTISGREFPGAATVPMMDKQSVLKHRAAALARKPQRDDPSASMLEIVEFLLANETYAIESACVREVYPLKNLTPVPCTPNFVLGLVNLRGQILSVIDMRKIFGLPSKVLTNQARVIVLWDGVKEFGILAESMIGVKVIKRDTLHVALPTLTDVRARYLLGVAEDRVIVLDGVRILQDNDLLVQDDVPV